VIEVAETDAGRLPAGRIKGGKPDPRLGMRGEALSRAAEALNGVKDL
jgi:hypothetical protein